MQDSRKRCLYHDLATPSAIGQNQSCGFVPGFAVHAQPLHVLTCLLHAECSPELDCVYLGAETYSPAFMVDCCQLPIGRPASTSF